MTRFALFNGYDMSKVSRKIYYQLDNWMSLVAGLIIENGTLKIVRGAFIVIKAEKIPTNQYILLGETLQETNESVASSESGEESTMLWLKTKTCQNKA